MHGDFSNWPVNIVPNAVGPLHQQGRVLTDVDFNAIAAILTDWQDEAARVAFGAGVAAVSTEMRDSYKVLTAIADAAGAEVTLHPGELWADGWRVTLAA